MDTLDLILVNKDYSNKVKKSEKCFFGYRAYNL